jgi:rare lipoprotein A (peptidoglycan hydrolase)
MRAAEDHTLADDMTETEPKAIMLRIADDNDRLTEWAEKSLSGSPILRFAPVAACAALCFSLANCAPSARLPKGGGVYRVGSPYIVAGRFYVPQDNPHYRADGVASWYGSDFHGRSTANGEIFDAEAITAAHPTLPLPSYVRVTNLSNGRSLIVRVNDRGPYAGNRIVDVSKRAAYLLGFTVSGTAWVRVEYVGPAPIEGSDDRVLEATLREGEPAPAPSTTKLATLRSGSDKFLTGRELY